MTKTVVVFDPVGDVVALLAELELPLTVRPLTDPAEAARYHADLVLVGAAGPVEWNVVSAVGVAPTVILTSAYQRAEAIEALRRDLVGYVDIRTPTDALKRSLSGVLWRDEAAFTRDVLGRALRLRRETRPSAIGLTRRQHEIVSLIATGATDKEIAQALGIARTTAQKHVAKILDRLGVPNRAAAAVALVGASRSAA